MPAAIQVVPRDLIVDQGGGTLTRALQNVSGVDENHTGGNRGATFKARGFVSPAYAIDGNMLNPLGDRPATFVDMANVERIEVLKGPASALYGQGQPGGLINIVTRRPGSQFEADASAQAARSMTMAP